tara:strand:+ start:8505 stop:8681 length:177 start_codon:yes stop_codon:yes gene_type:complete
MKILEILFILQKKDNNRRLNPYHPLSYLILIGSILIGTVLFGIIGFWKEVGKNPFKYQ